MTRTVTKYFIGQGVGSWTPPSSTTTTAELWGAGQAGDNSTGNGTSGATYSKKNSLSLTAGTAIKFNLGAPGTTSTQPGGDTWLVSAATVIAPGGGSGTSAIGDTIHAGGAGGLLGTGVGSIGCGGGGGAGGPSAAGSVGGAGGNAVVNTVGGGGGGGAANGGGTGTAGTSSGATSAAGGAGGGANGGAGATLAVPLAGNGGKASGGGGGLATLNGTSISYPGAGGDDYDNGGGGAGGNATDTSGGDGVNGGTPGGAGSNPGGVGTLIGRGGYAEIKLVYTGANSDPDQLFFVGVSNFTGQIPASWTLGSKLELWGGGGNGANGSPTLGGAGGGSGGYTAKLSFPVTAGGSLTNITAGNSGIGSSVGIGSPWSSAFSTAFGPLAGVNSVAVNAGGAASITIAGSGAAPGNGDINIAGNNGGGGLSNSAAGGASGGGAPGATGNGVVGGIASISGTGAAGGNADAGEVIGGAGGINNGTNVTGPGTAGTTDMRAGAGGGGGGHNTTAANAAGGNGGWPGGGGAGGGAGATSTGGIGGAGLVLLTQLTAQQFTQAALCLINETFILHKFAQQQTGFTLTQLITALKKRGRSPAILLASTLRTAAWARHLFRIAGPTLTQNFSARNPLPYRTVMIPLFRQVFVNQNALSTTQSVTVTQTFLTTLFVFKGYLVTLLSDAVINLQNAISINKSIPLAVTLNVFKQLPEQFAFLLQQSFVLINVAGHKISLLFSQTISTVRFFAHVQLLSLSLSQNFTIVRKAIIRFTRITLANSLLIQRAVRSILLRALFGQIAAVLTGKFYQRTQSLLNPQIVNTQHNNARIVATLTGQNFTISKAISSAAAAVIHLGQTLSIIRRTVRIIGFSLGSNVVAFASRLRSQLATAPITQSLTYVRVANRNIVIAQAQAIVTTGIRFLQRNFAITQTQLINRIVRVTAARSITLNQTLTNVSTARRILAMVINQTITTINAIGRRIALLSAQVVTSIGPGKNLITASLHQAQTFITNRITVVPVTGSLASIVYVIKTASRLISVPLAVSLLPIGRAIPSGRVIISILQSLIGIAIPKYHRKVPGVSLAQFTRGVSLAPPQGLPIKEEQ